MSQFVIAFLLNPLALFSTSGNNYSKHIPKFKTVEVLKAVEIPITIKVETILSSETICHLQDHTTQEPQTINRIPYKIREEGANKRQAW
jgi:hypothetical protein